MKRDLAKLAGVVLLVGVLVALPACAGSAGVTTPVPPAPRATATPPPAPQPKPSPTAALAPTTAPTTTPAAAATPPAGTQPPSSAGSGNTDLLEKGKLVFEETAGGVGCASCHGLDGKGAGTSGESAPDIRGASEARLRAALGGGVPLMSFIKLSEEEMTAVVAYLQYLNEQS